MQKYTLNMHNFVKSPKGNEVSAQAQHPADRQRKGESALGRLLGHSVADGLHHRLANAGRHQNEHKLFLWLNGQAKQLLRRFAAHLAALATVPPRAPAARAASITISTPSASVTATISSGCSVSCCFPPGGRQSSSLPCVTRLCAAVLMPESKIETRCLPRAPG